MFGHDKDRHLHSSFAGTKGMLLAGPAFRGFAHLPKRMIESPSPKKSRQVEEKKHVEIPIKSLEVTIIRDQNEINYSRHQQLIDEFTATNIEILRKNINDLPFLVDPVKPCENLVYKNIPESRGNNIFYLIIFNADLPNNVKKELLGVLIFNRGYDKWAIQLFNNPFYKKLLENGLCFQVLEDIYIKSFVNKNILPKDTEKHFLIQCFQYSRLRPFDYYKMQKDSNKKFQLLSYWIGAQTNAIDVITVYDTIRDRSFGLNDVYLKIFLKLAKQKILDIEIKNHTVNHKDEEQVRDFLDINRSKWTSCFACLFTRRSVDIHRMIKQGNIAQATEAWKYEEKGLNNFYNQYGLR